MSGRSRSAAAAILVALVAAGCGSDRVQLVPGDAAAGAVLYEARCAGCHGAAGEGAEAGPPLDDPLYVSPGYSDQELARAVRNGAQQEHWDLGAMPGFRSLNDRELSDLVAFVRDLQAG